MRMKTEEMKPYKKISVRNIKMRDIIQKLMDEKFKVITTINSKKEK